MAGHRGLTAFDARREADRERVRAKARMDAVRRLSRAMALDPSAQGFTGTDRHREEHREAMRAAEEEARDEERARGLDVTIPHPRARLIAESPRRSLGATVRRWLRGLLP